MFEFIRRKLAFLYEDSYESQLKNYKISQVIFKMLKLFSFCILAFVSLNLSMDLFKEFGSTEKDVNFFILTVIGLELSKMIALILAKSEFYVKRVKNTLLGIGFSLLFIGLAFVSVYSSYGFILVATEKTSTSNIALSYDSDIKYNQEKIENLDIKIQSYIPQLERGDLSLASKDKLEKQLQAWEQEKDKLYQEVRSMQKQSQEQESLKESVGMFTLMARDMNVDERQLRFWMMIILVFVIELCIMVMSPHINIIKPEYFPPKVVPTPVIEETWLPDSGNISERKEKRSYRRRVETKKEKEPVAVASIKEEPPMEVILTEIKEEPIKEEPVPPIVEEKPIHVRETAFEKFIKCSFDNGTNLYLKDRQQVASELGMPATKIIQYHNILSTFRNPKNHQPLIEFRKDSGKWHPNFTDQVILNLYKSGILKIEGESNAS